MLPKLFSFTHFRKNAPANPLESHTFKTKDLKPFRFTHLQKKGGGPLSHQPPLPPLPPRVKADGPPPIFGISGLDCRHGYIQCVSAAIPEGAMPNPLWQN